MIDNYLDLLKEANERDMKRIPWRSGKIPIVYGSTDIEGLSQKCLILNDLKFVMKLNPSLMLIIPKIEALGKIGGGTNGWLVTARKAQQLEFKKLEQGSCDAKTYFFGRPKEGRTLDWVQRIGERGFSIENISGISVFPDNSKIDFTVDKRDYSKSSFFTGWQIKSRGFTKKKNSDGDDTKILVPMRIKRVK
jgi:hypothetical protein